MGCRSAEAAGCEGTRRVKFGTMIAVHDIYDSRCSKISFCSTVARIRSFHINNTPVGYTWTNTPRLVHGFSFSLISDIIFYGQSIMMSYLNNDKLMTSTQEQDEYDVIEGVIIPRHKTIFCIEVAYSSTGKCLT